MPAGEITLPGGDAPGFVALAGGLYACQYVSPFTQSTNSDS